MGNLSNLYISQSFQSLIHLGNDSTVTSSLTTLQDGYGNSIGVAVNTQGDLYLSGSLTASLQEGYLYVGNASGKTSAFATSSLVTNINTGSLVTTSSFNQYTASNDSKVNQLISATGSYATTGSNTFTGQQNIQNTLVIEESGNPLINTQIYQSSLDSKLYINQAGATGVKFDNVNVEMSELTASLQQGYVWVGNSSGQTTTVSTSSFGGGGTINTGSFATTGSNIFYGDQFISGNQNHLYSVNDNGTQLMFGVSENGQGFDMRVTSSLSPQQQTWFIENQGGVWGNAFFGRMYIDSNLNVNSTLSASLQEGYVWVGNSSGRTTTVSTSSFGGGASLPAGVLSSSVTNFVDYSASVDTRINNIVSGTGFATTGSNTFTGQQNIQNNLVIEEAGNPLINTQFTQDALTNKLQINQGGASGVTFNTNVSMNELTASLQEGYVWAGGTGNISTLVATSSFGGGGTINTSSFATTGSNNFIGVETIGDVPGGSGGEVYLLGRSGSLVLSNSTATPTYASLSHISSSQINSNTNLIFKTSTATADTIVSGSNNLFVNPAAATAGFKRYIGGSANIALNASNVPQISGSMQFSPTMNNNIFNGNSTATTMRGPVSSSAWTISGNSLQGQMLIGTNATNHAQGIVAGLNMLSNVTNGNFGVIANKANLTQALNVSQNSIGGALTLTAASSSIAWAGNTTQGTVTLTNTVSGSGATVAAGANAVYANQNIIGGSLTILASGAELSDDPTGVNFLRTFERNLITGNGNTVSLNSNTTGSHALASTAIIGNNLTITGSSASPLFNSGITNHGAAFFGRYNAQDGNRAKSSETVFAIGTGTSTSNRKTGFLIDSGSNTFVEGTLNVSGSSSFTGSISITETIKLTPLDPLPAGVVGELAVSGSNLFFYNGAWTQVI